ncbi:oxidoreductase [Caulobacter sp. CCNWLY153]|uniref:oxidoreductase n=1 Tax=unclassified Caulobacter TaxID=2648921 RepID=UPI002FEEA3EC
MTIQRKKIALVTGASAGIGQASAQALAASGYTVYGTSRRPTVAAPNGVRMVVCDVTDETSVRELVAEVLAEAGQIDVLVNNAGLGLTGGAEESSIGQVQALFDVNLFGVMRMTNAVLPSMRARRQGRVLNISSVLGLIPAPYSAHYAATKHALEGYSESLDHEVRAFNVRVSLIEPGYIRSTFDQNAVEADAQIAVYDQARAGVRALLDEVMPTAELPEVVAAVVRAAAVDPQPRLRYPAGKLAKQIALLRRFAPAKAFDKSLRKQMRLPA